MKRVHVLVLLLMINFKAISQELEPRMYANLPVGTNAIAAAYGLAKGNVIGDPTLPITNLKITTHNFIAGYVRTFGLFNKLARVQVTAPFVHMAGQLKINGRDTSGTRTGLGDTRIRFGINLIGSPALKRADFRAYQQKTIVGISFVTSIPTGVYYKEKAINIGSNRWAFKPEIGISRRFKQLYAEGYIGVWFYADNNEFLGTKKLEQKPVFSAQGHAIYYFKNRMWVGANFNWFNGGTTYVNNSPNGPLLNNWRAGATWSVPVKKQHSLKLQFHTGAFTNTGYDYDLVVLGYQYVFF